MSILWIFVRYDGTWDHMFLYHRAMLPLVQHLYVRIYIYKCIQLCVNYKNTSILFNNFHIIFEMYSYSVKLGFFNTAETFCDLRECVEMFHICTRLPSVNSWSDTAMLLRNSRAKGSTRFSNNQVFWHKVHFRVVKTLFNWYNSEKKCPVQFAVVPKHSGQSVSAHKISNTFFQ